MSEVTVEKVILSPFERGFDVMVGRLAYAVPKSLTPNDITALGFASGMLAAAAILATPYAPACLLLAALGIFGHMFADSLDGAVARERQLVSKSGYYLDQIADITIAVSIFVALGFSPYARLELMVVPALIYPFNMVVILHWIASLEKWPFPAFGPFELQFILIVVCIASYFLGPQITTIQGYPMSLFDLGALLVTPLSVFEAYRSARLLYKELRAAEAPSTLEASSTNDSSSARSA